jgi:amidase
MSPLGLGNDGLGSLRWPAQCCGVAALKPTLGRIPHASSLEPADGPIGLQLCTVEGPMARRVGDLRAAFEVLAGPSWRDPWSVPAPLQGAPLHRPIRVALVTDPAGQGTTPQVRDALRKAADGLAGAGYAVDDIEPPGIADAAQVLLDMLNTTDVHALDDRMSGFLPPPTRQFLAAFYEVAGDRDQVRIMTAFTTRQALLRRWGEFQEERPLILAPISTDLPFEVGRDLALEEVAATIRGMRMAMAVNALGLPAVAVPVGVAEGLPQVIQIIGPRYREDLCLDAAEALEQAFGPITPIDPAGGTIS